MGSLSSKIFKLLTIITVGLLTVLLSAAETRQEVEPEFLLSSFYGPSFHDSFLELQRKDLLAHQDIESLPKGGYCFSIWAFNTLLCFIFQGTTPLRESAELKLFYQKSLRELDVLYKNPENLRERNFRPFFQKLQSLMKNPVSIHRFSIKKASQDSFEFRDFMNTGISRSNEIFRSKGIAFKIYWKAKNVNKRRAFSSHIVGVITNQNELFRK